MKEGKLRWVGSWRKGCYIGTPEGIARHTFLHKVNDWAKMHGLYGPDALGRRRSNRLCPAEDRMAAVARVLAGESMGAVSKSIGMTQPSQPMRWLRVYSERGMEGLESMRKGRPPTMPRKKPKKPGGESGELAALRARNECLETELACQKKLDALATAGGAGPSQGERAEAAGRLREEGKS
jgi:transposase-like protein